MNALTDEIIVCVIALLLCLIWLLFYTGWPQAIVTALTVYLTLRALLRQQR